MMCTPERFLALCCAAAAFGGPLLSQCQAQWQPGEPLPGPRLSGAPQVLTWWDPDGPGPRSQVLVGAGTFAIPGLGATDFATFDPAAGEWGAFPGPVPTGVTAMAALADGRLVVGGSFDSIGGAPIARVGAWDGVSWTSLGGGVTGQSTTVAPVTAMQLLPNGDLAVGGNFTAAGTVSARGLARWDGSQWHGIGGFAGEVQKLALQPNGNLVAAGSFPEPGTSNWCNIAAWDGALWHTFGTGIQLPGVQINALAALANGDVAVGGLFASIGGVRIHGMARWDGSAWNDLSLTTSGSYRPSLFLALPNGDLLLPNVAPINRYLPSGVIRWDGAQWTNFAPDPGPVAALTTLPSGELLASVSTFSNYADPWRGLARWDGSNWQPMSHGLDDAVKSLLPLPNGDVLAVGAFRAPSAAGPSQVAVWDGQRFHALAPVNTQGGGLLGLLPSCAALDDQQRLWLGGQVTSSGYSPVVCLTATGWQMFGYGPMSVNAMDVSSPLHPIVAGDYYSSYGGSISQWNGVGWAALGDNFDGPTFALLRLHNGDLIAGGAFLNFGTTPASRIARWDGSSWHPLGYGLDGPVRALAELPNGEVVAAGEFVMDGFGVTSLNLVARFDGVAWQPFGQGLAGAPGVRVSAALVLPTGDLLVGGSFSTAGGSAVRGVARWHGGAWQAVDGGTDGDVAALALRQNGDVVAGGTFAHAGSQPAGYFAVLRSPCAPTVAIRGVGCAGSYGALDLVADSLPWLGDTFRTTCYGVSPGALAAVLYGQQPAQLSLALLSPQAGAGCELLLQPAFLALTLPQMGAVSTSLPLPNDPRLLGVPLLQQLLVAESAGGALQLLASSNALQFALGSF